MAEAPSTAPVLSTASEHLFTEPIPNNQIQAGERLTDSEIFSCYEIERTASELITGGWICIALQFPDSLLQDAPRIVELLQTELAKVPVSTEVQPGPGSQDDHSELETSMNEVSLNRTTNTKQTIRRLYILGDTSYGACCVDEIAAEHIDAEVVVHYGRACLSPTARLPVIYVYTKQPLDHDDVVKSFMETYPDKDSKIILMADVMYSSHIETLYDRLKNEAGYTNILAPAIIHDPSSPIPNRLLPQDLQDNPDSLKDYNLFHISSPPTALLLTLSSRLSSTTIYPTTSTPSETTQRTIRAQTTSLLRRRYGLLTSLSTTPIFGILINTLSVSRYSSAASQIATQLRLAGKKSYTFVVGKINAAKIANFAEIGGWVVVGCWESSLVEGDGFWRPVITPFELGVVLAGDRGRVWTGEWRGDFGGWVDGASQDAGAELQGSGEGGEDGEDGEDGSEDESAPPEFDLRTGRYISHTRPMASSNRREKKTLANGESSTSLIKRGEGDLAVIGNEISPGAEFLRTQRTWRGLGSDITIEYDEDGHESGTLIQEGRSGIARGYANEER